jgi:LPXTG-site transpeptidase (sortase) family protein
MEWHITAAAWLVRAGRRAYGRKWNFLGLCVFVFLGTVFTLSKSNLLPDAPLSPTISLASVSVSATSSAPILGAEEPVKISIPTISLSASVANPTTTDVGVLDGFLLKGAVRYPTSAKLGEIGNVVLFGHSSYLPIVGNQAYKTFDGIQKLVAGQMITVYSTDAVYTYRVRSVSKESAASDAGIPLSVTGRVLTLVTCNSFATKSDRFIVVADFVESRTMPR